MRPALLTALLPLALAACAQPADEPTPPAATPESTQPAAAPAQESANAGAAFESVLAGDWRTPEFTERDRYRNPGQTLAFFGLQPNHTVVEITPGGGWYAEILAPYVRDEGRYVAAVVDPEALPEDRRGYPSRSLASLQALFQANPARFDRAEVVRYDPAAPSFGEPGSADMVLTFRNVHNWLGSGQAEGMFAGFFEVLRPGGVLGVVDHRAADGMAEYDDSGYVGQDRMIALAEAAGFQFDASSEVNANPRDTKDHPNGVWTLPPTNNHEDADAERYAEIGESDRMTLRFVKPE
ncbi:class I SAM-dependent methyltransferase [Luteimonas sp. JM171]|uniref:class I SAM-dependent methyltransferase n=1 Tax=Luteimonas sp. JM171 TaxID=1896164 RepID=UPI000858B45F|nr:class I SAM-dependent methyltransferase [Luteimonas sp. JM171]AOH35821.1 methyltransferase [Luteimonas sp. JM171]